MADPPDLSASPGPGSGGLPSEAQWVPLARAAELTGSTEAWLMDRCRDGRLPHRPVAGSASTELLVPLSTARALVNCEITE